ncbi:AraC family transcriptional regulator [Erysipelothrix larvae]|uniref:AraC family transcriptional regulator n=1 Tax=Erysipelothrix larvae TaxID=1514105 RepID=UPI000B05A52E|nr:helix-turn-helix transcriptional regulator [Erysipelothrix larvae]
MIQTYIINKAEDYVEDHLQEKITLDDIANHIGVSKYHFHRLFKQATNETLHAFISRIKMERSALFLKVDTQSSLTDIAYAYGYCDASAYIRAFKKQFHMTPSEFKNRKISQSSHGSFRYTSTRRTS